MKPAFLLLALFALPVAAAPAQRTPPPSSSSSDAPASEPSSSPRVRRPEASGSAITLETSEPMFDIAAALNACGYDADLAHSDPIRAEVRADIDAASQATPAAAASRKAVCGYIHEHELSDKARELAQYVSLGIYLGPAPELKPTADETDLPPDANSVISMLPLLRTFADAINLHLIWVKHHPGYDAITDRVHDPVTNAILGVNGYLKVPVSSYDGRTLLILVEPMLAPNNPNARIYASDYVLVTSPSASGTINLNQVRHLYLQYVIEPLVYARAQSMERLLPLLKPMQNAPVEYVYKTDIVALLNECLVKAIEARTLDTGLTPPSKPSGTRERVDLARYDEELATYNRQAEDARRKLVDLDMRQGWVMTDYFYNQLISLEKTTEGLGENIGQMVYGMDVGRERHHAEQIVFLPVGSGEYVKRAPRQLTPMQLAEKRMLEGNLEGAQEIADKALADPKQTPEDHAEALYVKARVDLLEGDPETSGTELAEVLKTATSPRTQAWAHIYLGRLSDIKVPAERQQAIAQYKAALGTPGVTPDAKAAAEASLKNPFVVPKVVHEEEQPLDPTGKAEKEAYKPDPK